MNRKRKKTNKYYKIFKKFVKYNTYFLRIFMDISYSLDI